MIVPEQLVVRIILVSGATPEELAELKRAEAERRIRAETEEREQKERREEEESSEMRRRQEEWVRYQY